MVADDVSEFVPDDVAQLVVVEQRNGTRIQNDEGLFHAVGAGVYDGRLRNEEVVFPLHVERLQHLAIHLVNARELVRSHLDRVRLKSEPDRLLSEDAEELAKHLVKYGQATKRLKCRLVGRVFPGSGCDFSENARCPRRIARGRGRAVVGIHHEAS